MAATPEFHWALMESPVSVGSPFSRITEACPFPAAHKAWGDRETLQRGRLSLPVTYRCDEILPRLAWSDSDRLNAPIKLDPILKSLSWIYF